MIKYRISGWEDLQQYKDRSPKWIKLHRELLQKREWVMSDDPSRALMIALMLMACLDEENTIPGDEDYIAKVGCFKKVSLKPLVDIGFLIPYKTVQECTELYDSVQINTPSSLLFSSLNDSKNINNEDVTCNNLNNKNDEKSYSNETFDIDNWKKQSPAVMVKWSEAEGIPEEFGEYAEKLGFFPDRIHREAAKFHGYWTLGTGARKRRVPRRWFQAWQNWINKAAKGE